MKNISFLTNVAKDNLEYTKLLLNSLQTNLDNPHHQIIVFVDVDNEQSLEYLLSIQHSFHDLCIIHNTTTLPIGYQRNTTLLTEYAKYDIVSYLQSDMVVGAHYDTEILKYVQRGRILSATRVEPPLHGESAVTITKNLGLRPDEFDLAAWTNFSETIKRDELINFFFAPLTYYKEDWLALGGYDTTFRRSREDSDFVQRCLHAGIELVQTFSANVYHFTCVSSRGANWFDANNPEVQQRNKLQQIADTIELRKFLRKWGNFNHGEEPLHKLDIDLVIKNYELQAVYELEPFFSRVWLTSQSDVTTLLNEYGKLDSIANELFDISAEVWDAHKHLYKTDNFDEIFCVGEPENFSIKVTIDFNNISKPNQLLSNIRHLYALFHECEPGQYTLDEVDIVVNAIKLSNPPHVVDNPPFDYTLLKVY
jgi:hypothetical protein